MACSHYFHHYYNSVLNSEVHHSLNTICLFHTLQLFTVESSLIKYLELKEINLIENNFLYENTFWNRNHISYSNIKYQLLLQFLFPMFLYEAEVTIHSLHPNCTLNYIYSYTFVFLSNGQTIQKKTLLQYHNKLFTKAHSIILNI